MKGDEEGQLGENGLLSTGSPRVGIEHTQLKRLQWWLVMRG